MYIGIFDRDGNLSERPVVTKELDVMLFILNAKIDYEPMTENDRAYVYYLNNDKMVMVASYDIDENCWLNENREPI